MFACKVKRTTCETFLSYCVLQLVTRLLTSRPSVPLTSTTSPTSAVATPPRALTEQTRPRTTPWPAGQPIGTPMSTIMRNHYANLLLTKALLTGLVRYTLLCIHCTYCTYTLLTNKKQQHVVFYPKNCLENLKKDIFAFSAAVDRCADNSRSDQRSESQ